MSIGAAALGIAEAMIVGALALTAFIPTAAHPHKPAASTTFTLTGTFALTDSTGIDPCSPTGGYSDIQTGTQVIVADASNKTLAIGSLDAGVSNGATCNYTFSVPDVPKGPKFYGIEVSHRGFVPASARDAELGIVALSLGN